MKKSLFFAAALLALAACTREVAIDSHPGDMTITARTETSADTKTLVEGGTHVYWEPGDEIKVFAGGKSGKFTTDISASSASATFNGTLGEDAWTEGMDLWAVYPYSKDAVFSDGTITTVLPSEQVARAGSFGKGMNLSIAHSNGDNLQFYNVGGGIRFRLTQEGIKKVTFEGYGGEFLAGTVKMGFDENGLPVIKEVADGRRTITLLPPSGNDSFPTNVWFYCVALPGSLAFGYKLEFYRDTEYSRMASEKAVTIKRSIFGSIDKADEECVFIPIPNTIFTPDAIDMGLSVKWASFNVGASKPEEYGFYYAWGETEPKEEYSLWSYKWCYGLYDEFVFTKYCDEDGKTVLDLEDDAAHVNLGGKWRMPTFEELKELVWECNWIWITQNGVSGRQVYGPSGNSIFLPGGDGLWESDSPPLPGHGSYGCYWTSSLQETDPLCAWELWFEPNGYGPYWVDVVRGEGKTVRPVWDDTLE